MMILNFININKIITISICIILTFFCLIGCTAELTNTYIIEQSEDGYEIAFYDNTGNIIFKEHNHKEPFIEQLTNSLFKVVTSTGVNSNYTYFVNTISGNKSDVFFNLLYSNENSVVFLANGTLIVADMFNLENRCAEINRDFSKTAVPQSAILSVTINSDILCVNYLKGSMFEEVYEEIDIENKGTVLDQDKGTVLLSRIKTV